MDKQETNTKKSLFKDVLYKNKGGAKGFGLFGFLLAFFASLVIWFIHSPNFSVETVRTVTLICGIIIGLGILIILWDVIVSTINCNRICFAVFPEYLLFYTRVKPSKKREYIKIDYQEIEQYTFEAFCSYSDKDTTHLFPRYHNTGVLKVSVRGAQYRAYIKNIAKARECIKKFILIDETMQKR